VKVRQLPASVGWERPALDGAMRALANKPGLRLVASPRRCPLSVCPLPGPLRGQRGRSESMRMHPGTAHWRWASTRCECHARMAAAMGCAKGGVVERTHWLQGFQPALAPN
jgi:hypothetical protein